MQRRHPEFDLGRSVLVGHPAHCENEFDDKLYQIKIGELLVK